MSSNVGLSTPRGTGTSGYVQRNLSHLRPRDDRPPPRRPDGANDEPLPRAALRQADAGILDHERRRRIEAGVFALRCELEDGDDEVDEEEIDRRCDARRKELESEEARAGGASEGGRVKGLKSHQVHELAAAKIREDERIRRALGIGQDGKADAGGWRQRDKGGPRGPGARQGGDGWVEREGNGRGRKPDDTGPSSRRRSRSPRRERSPRTREQRSPLPRRASRSSSRNSRSD